jgi:hypothetical protein
MTDRHKEYEIDWKIVYDIITELILNDEEAKHESEI